MLTSSFIRNGPARTLRIAKLSLPPIIRLVHYQIRREAAALRV